MMTLLKKSFPTALKTQAGSSRAIFCINPGRSGSNYLAMLLGTSREAVSFHEPDPPMTGKYLQMVNTRPYAATKNFRRTKADVIKRILLSLSSQKVYCETNHMFIKTFFDVVVDNIENIDVIILRREMRQVLRSFIELKYFSAGNTEWSKWMTSPNAVTSAVPAIYPDIQLDQYDLCIAYLIDIEARAQRFKQDYPWIKVHEVQLSELNKHESVHRLFNDLRITPSRRTYQTIGNRINERRHKKQYYNNLTDAEYCNQRIMEYIAKAKSKGICVPNTLLIGS